MEKKNAFKEIQDLLDKLRKATDKLKEQSPPVPEDQQDAVILPFKKHNEQ